MSYSVVVLNRYPDLAERFLASVRATHSVVPHILLIGDGHCTDFGEGVDVVRSPYEEFCYGRNFNFALSLIPEGHDVICANDDTLVTEPDFFNRLAGIAGDVTGLGILSPLIQGCAGTPTQRFHERDRWWVPGETIKRIYGAVPVCFVCVWLCRRMIDAVGAMDEIKSYGGEDAQYCLRARRAGWLTCISSQLRVVHGTGGPELDDGRGKTWSTSFARRYP